MQCQIKFWWNALIYVVVDMTWNALKINKILKKYINKKRIAFKIKILYDEMAHISPHPSIKKMTGKMTSYLTWPMNRLPIVAESVFSSLRGWLVPARYLVASHLFVVGHFYLIKNVSDLQKNRNLSSTEPHVVN